MDRPRLRRNLYLTQPWLWVGAFLLVTGLIFGSSGLGDLRAGLQLARDGITTEATITGHETRILHMTNGAPRTVFALTLRFEDPEGQPRDISHRVPHEDYLAAEIGDTGPLVYSASQPDLTEINPGHHLRLAAGYGGIGLIALIAGLIASRIGWRNQAARRRAATIGTPARAQVTAILPTGRETSERVTVTWREGTRQGRTRSMPRRLAPRVGERVTIWTDPVTQRAFWEGEF